MLLKSINLWLSSGAGGHLVGDEREIPILERKGRKQKRKRGQPESQRAREPEKKREREKRKKEKRKKGKNKKELVTYSKWA